MAPGQITAKETGNAAIADDDAPLITIGVTCYNAADTIHRAIESAVNQTWSKKEIIIVNDKSSDDSSSVLKKIQQSYPEIRIIHHEENRGYAGALNTIIENAAGDLIAFFDDDDDSVPDRLSEQYQRIKQYEKTHDAALILCYSNRNVVKSGATTPDHIAKAIGRRPTEPHGPAVAEAIFGYAADPKFVWGMFGSCTMLARKQVFARVGAFDETFRRCAEWDFAIRMAFLDGHFIAVNKPLITMYKTSGTDKSGKIPLKYALLIRKKYKDYLTKKHLYLASRGLAHARFHGNKGRKLRSYGFLTLAYLSAPRLLLSKLKTKLVTKHE